MSQKFYSSERSINSSTGFTMTRFSPQYLPVNFKTISMIAMVIVASNLFTGFMLRPSLAGAAAASKEAETDTDKLYLIDKASLFVSETVDFEERVRDVAYKLEIPPEWLMAVMYSESRFDASVANKRGSGAVGLIQWMPSTAKSLGTTSAKLKKMSPEDQMEYVEKYLKNMQKRYGDFQSLTELYLAILYPKALEGDYCYTLYSKPSRRYKQNSGLDENKDGRVTVSDVDKRMQRVFPTAYLSDFAEK